MWVMLSPGERVRVRANLNSILPFNFVFFQVCDFPGTFALTPALSPRERETRRPSFCEPDTFLKSKANSRRWPRNLAC